jgi:hypothetical protein
MEPQLKPRIATKAELLLKAKRVYRETINHYSVTDQHLEQVIDKILSGTRNVNYLPHLGANVEPRMKEIYYFLLRETIS